MNHKKLQDFAIVSMSGRQLGKTTLLAKAAKELGGVFVCHNKVQARQVSKEHQVRTMTLDDEPRGLQGPVIFDHYALEFMLFKAGSTIEDLERANSLLTEKYHDSLKLIKRYKEEYDKLLRTMGKTKTRKTRNASAKSKS